MGTLTNGSEPCTSESNTEVVFFLGKFLNYCGKSCITFSDSSLLLSIVLAL